MRLQSLIRAICTGELLHLQGQEDKVDQRGQRWSDTLLHRESKNRLDSNPKAMHFMAATLLYGVLHLFF